MKLRKKHARPSAPPDMRLLTLCICFLIGMLAAWPVHRRIGSEALAQLGAYVQSYAQLAEGRVQQPSSVLSTAAAYLRCPLLAFLCGLSAAGAVLIPALCMVQGFCLSFSVCCFTAAFGGAGALLSMAVFGIRSLASVPGFFLLAVPALRSAALRSPLPFGRGKRVASAGNDTGRWKRLCAVSAALLAALLLESALSSGLLRLVWEHFIAA